MTDTATYLFAITQPIAPELLADISGIEDAPVRAIEEGGIAGIGCDVPLEAFGEEPLKENLEDLGWLERTAREHDLVVRLVAQHVTTAPLRMATIYRNDDAVRELLRNIGGVATDVLTRLSGRDEWGVKLYGTPQAAEPETSQERGASGADYLRHRRSALTARQELGERAAKDAAQIYAQLSDACVASRSHRLQDAQLTGVSAPMLLNGAFLVDRSTSGDFNQAVKELAEAHSNLRFTLTGPWPAYSFASLEDER